MITDLQKESQRINDVIIKKINYLYKNENSFFKYTKTLISLFRDLIKNKTTKTIINREPLFK